MAFPTTYNGWVAYIRNWIGADEYSDAQIGSFMDLGQVRLNSDLSTYWMEKVFHQTILAPNIGQPIDLLATIPDFNGIRLVAIQGQGALDVAVLNEFVDKVNSKTNIPANPKLYNIDHGQLSIWPNALENSVLDIYYYQMVPALSQTNNTNIFTLYHPDAYLYAATMEAAPYMVEDERVPVWENKYTVAISQANSNRNKLKIGSTPLVRKIVSAA